jgi:hypothetical protein
MIEKLNLDKYIRGMRETTRKASSKNAETD